MADAAFLKTKSDIVRQALCRKGTRDVLILQRASYIPGNFVPCYIKTLRGDRTAAERKLPLLRPAAGGESCKAGFFVLYQETSFPVI
ncbi:hypothetical protein DW757_08610 [Clostridium sp. AM29-11AC]|nr:hypothetical protein DW757_08610 [Clostridium sp. AM29-11AC]